MRISQAKSKAVDLEVVFEEGSLQIVYRPISYSLNELDEMQAESTKTGGTQDERKARMVRIATLISRMIVSWDLEDDNGEPIDPTNIDALQDVPSNIFTEIIMAVKEHNEAGKAASNSDAG